jgi:Mlc titration factor MtfA (ptsG expression regulator)
MSFLRRRHDGQGFPEVWRTILAERVAAWPVLDAGERERLEALVLELLGGKRWAAAQGFELTEEVMLTVAGHAALLVLGDGLGVECYGNVTSIEVHATTIVVAGQQHTGLPGGLMFDGISTLDGLTQFRGPVFLAWDAVLADVRHPGRGRNVVLHEFAHTLDMLDGTVDGTPPLPRGAVARWAEVCEAELDLLRSGEPGGVLDAYGATNAGEFFAVATETFFTRPVELRDQKPALYEVLRDFYRQDPAARLTTSG